MYRRGTGGTVFRYHRHIADRDDVLISIGAPPTG
jgi:hypothetical protein